MAEPGEEILNPPTGERLIFRQTAASSDGELFQAELFMAPSDHRIGCHRHPQQEERFEVINGLLGTKIGDEVKVTGPGGEVVVPVNAPHGYWNAGNDELHIVYEQRPALRSTEFFVETYFGLSREGKLTKKGFIKNPLQLGVFAYAVRDFLRPCIPPAAAQGPLFALLSLIGRAFGYRAEYEKYRGRPTTQPPPHSSAP